ncbi:hypothetical protein HPB51_011889 [Rhipicephalus microplus]|uniref:Uncharacterized protein n=1 Tax=Rhipicephalus microplus TaxID=6941 RepID=A0A9J6E9T2_RHIMP|nr:hypothetical protein HPB51_011889 [Rhipicephalus microplus]
MTDDLCHADGDNLGEQSAPSSAGRKARSTTERRHTAGTGKLERQCVTAMEGSTTFTEEPLAPGKNVSNTLSESMETTEVMALESDKSRAEASDQISTLDTAEIGEQEPLAADDLMVTLDRIFEPTGGTNATRWAATGLGNLRGSRETIRESLYDTSAKSIEKTVREKVFIKKPFSTGSPTSEYECTQANLLVGMDSDGGASSKTTNFEDKDLSTTESEHPIYKSNTMIGKAPPASPEGHVRKRCRWDERESEITNDTVNMPMTSQQKAQVKRKTRELRTVLLNGRILKVTAEEQEDNQASGLNVNGIAPLPDGQFYNLAVVDPKEAPRAIYRKRDTDGVPVVFTSTVADVSFWDLNPNHFARELRAVAGDEILSHRMTNHGALVLYVNTGEMARKLLKLTTVAGMPVTVHVPRSYSKNMGKIRTVPFHYTDADIVTTLAYIGVVKARRQCKNLRMIDGTNIRFTRSNVVLTFRDDVQLPSHVRLGFLRFPVEPYVEPPIMCRNCQGYWHMARACYRPPHCRTCAGPHFHTECQSKDRPRCANCRGPHTAVHFRCPVRREAYKKKRYELAHFAT